MKAVVAHKIGTPEDLVIEDVPDPVPGAGDVLVEVAASAVTYPDVLMLGGKYQFTAPHPYVPGGEVAGTVVEVGSEVTTWRVGDRVLGGLGVSGGFAELALLPADRARRVPDDVEFDAAAGLEYAYGTALYALRDRGTVQAGEAVLVTGAAGSVGLAAIEVAKLLGATVIAAASSDSRLELCRSRGADEVINYGSEDLRERIKEVTGGSGLDAVFDNVGGDTAEPALRSLAWGGRFLVVGFAAGIPSMPLNLTLLKSCQIVGVFYGAMTGREPQRRADILDQLLGWTASGELRPVAATRVGLHDAPAALAALADRTAVGRFVVAP